LPYPPLWIIRNSRNQLAGELVQVFEQIISRRPLSVVVRYNNGMLLLALSDFTTSSNDRSAPEAVI
jgi:hypothetical protein